MRNRHGKFFHCPKHCNYCDSSFAECVCTGIAKDPETYGLFGKSICGYDLSGRLIYETTTDDVIG